MQGIHRHPIRLKVCGMRDPENIRVLLPLRPDYMGLIFYQKSPRYVGLQPNADWIRTQVPDYVHKIGVFVHASLPEVQAQAKAYGLQGIQLHGEADIQLLKALKAEGLSVWKAVGIGPDFDFGSLESAAPYLDAFVFDNQTPSHGGSGQQFDWSLLEDYHLPLPFLLAGGIGPQDAFRLLEGLPPGCMGLDLNSRFEQQPALKDIGLLQQFFQALRPTSSTTTP